MEIGEKILMMDGVRTIKSLLFECKYFKNWSLNEIDGYYMESIILPKTKLEKEEMKKYKNDWYIKLKEL